MKKFYENPTDESYNRRYCFVELDEVNFTFSTQSGHYYNPGNTYGERTSKKEYKKLETAQRNFDKKCAELESKGYVLSDSTYPVECKKIIETAKKENATEIELSIFHENGIKELVKLTQLKRAKIYFQCHPMEVPESITELKNLEHLELRGNFTGLPDNMGELTQLTSLDIDSFCDGKKFKLSESITLCKNLLTLTFGGGDLQSLPLNIGKLTKLEELEFESTLVSQIPDSIGNCKNLKIIQAGENEKLTSFPSSFGQLKNLEELHLSCCNFKQFPVEICSLKNLRRLDLSENKVASIPKEIGNLKKLEELELNHWFPDKGRISSLPESFFELSNLKELNLEGNRLKKLPEGFKKLSKLNELKLSHNAFPEEYLAKDTIDAGKIAIFKHLGWLAQKNQIAINSLSETEQASLLKRYSDPLSKFLKKSRSLEKSAKVEAKEIHNFLTFKTDDIPILSAIDYYSSDAFFTLHEIFAPFDQWTEMENRLMLVLTHSLWQVSPDSPMDTASSHYLRNYSTCFYAWYKKQVEQGREPEYADILALLKKYGKEENAFFVSLAGLYKVLMIDGKPSKFGQEVIKQFNAEPQKVLDEAKKDVLVLKHLASLLMKHSFESFEPYAEAALFEREKFANRVSKNQYFYIDTYSICELAMLNPEKYETLLLDIAKYVREDLCKAQVAVDLHYHYGDKHKDLIAKLVSQSIPVLDNLYEWNNNVLYLRPNTEKAQPTDYLNWVMEHYSTEAKGSILQRMEQIYIGQQLPYIQTVFKAYPEHATKVFANRIIQSENPQEVFKLLKDYDYSAYHQNVWLLLTGSNRDKRQLAAQELNRLYPPKEMIAKAQELLKEKKADKRAGGVQLLISLNNKESEQILQERLKLELDSTIRENLLTFLQNKGLKFDKNDALAHIEVLKEKGKLSAPISKWLDDSQLPDLYWKDGEKVDLAVVRSLFFNQKAKKVDWYKPALETLPILENIDKSKSGDFAHALLKLVLNNGSIKAPNKAFLASIAYLGDERVIQPFKKYCIDNKSPLPANLFANMEGEKVARALDAIIINYQSSYPNIQAAATNSFEIVAQKMGISSLELLDKMIPDFGFEHMFKELEIEGETWRAFVNSNLKLSFLNEDGASKKTLPSKTPKEIKESIKQINKDLRSVSKQQKARIELNFANNRRWTSEDWQAHFLQKPIPFALAQSLIWGIYEKGKLTNTFAINEDQTLENADFDEIELPTKSSIGMIHPIELDEAQIQAWQDYLKDNKIEQAFEQIDRVVYTPSKQEQKQTILHNFEDKSIHSTVFKSFMEKRAWRRGSVQDGGWVDTYRKAFPNEGIEVFIRLNEMSVQIWDYDEKAILQELFFTKLGSIETGSYVYDSYKDENDPRLIKIKDVPTLIYSETMYDLNALLKK